MQFQTLLDIRGWGKEVGTKIYNDYGGKDLVSTQVMGVWLISFIPIETRNIIVFNWLQLICYRSVVKVIV